MTTNFFAWRLWRRLVGMWDPGAGLRLLHVIAQAHGRLALHEVQHGRLLTLAEAEVHGLDPIILKNRAAQDAVRRRLGFFHEIEDVRVGGGHSCSVPPCKGRLLYYPIAFAMTNAAVAASPPTMTVCHALRNGRAVVNRPLMYPKTRRANRVTITEPIKAVWTERKKKYGASGTIPPAM